MGANSSILLLSLIEDILSLSRIEAGTFTLNATQFMIEELIETTSEIFEYQCSQKKIKLLIEIDPKLKKVPCKSDHGRIKQILLNLLSNALKFTFNGHIKIKAEMTVKNRKRYAQFSVSDTGIGIPQSEQPKLFKLFGMLDRSRAMNKNGWGIGLTVSKKYAEALGGRIWLESEHQKGTTVFFTIPYPDLVQNSDETLLLYDLSEEIMKEEEFPKKKTAKLKIRPMNNSFLLNASRNKLSNIFDVDGNSN
jgi:signal transduction histidine kinase